jgi:flagellar biogenesis protein FliO
MNSLLLALALSATSPEHSKEQADAVVAQAFAAPLHADVPEQASAPVAKLFGWGLALSAVAALVAFSLRRRSQSPSNGYAQLAQNLSVGPKRSLLVVVFGNKRMLVGATEGGFNVLASEPLTATPTAFDATLEQQLQAWSAQQPPGGGAA